VPETIKLQSYNEFNMTNIYNYKHESKL